MGVPPASVSVVLLTYQRPVHLRACLSSLAQADPSGIREFLIAVNGEDPEGEALGLAFRPPLGQAKVLSLPRSSRGAARNKAVSQAQGEWVYFLDDDAYVRPDTFLTLQRLIRSHPEAWAIGGPHLTPPQSEPFQQCVGYVLSTWLGAGRMRWRFREEPREGWADERALSLCNLCLRREVFSREGLGFPESFLSAEENWLLQELERRGRRAVYSPSLSIFHHRRDSWLGFADQIFKSGVGRMQILLTRPRSLRPAFLAPALFGSYLVGLGLVRLPLYWLPLGVYALAVAWHALRFALRAPPGGGTDVLGLASLRPLGAAPLRGTDVLGLASLRPLGAARALRAALRVGLLFPTCHLAYAFGTLWALGFASRTRSLIAGK